jgi:hypothetical protein
VFVFCFTSPGKTLYWLETAIFANFYELLAALGHNLKATGIEIIGLKIFRVFVKIISGLFLLPKKVHRLIVTILQPVKILYTLEEKEYFFC